MPEEMTWLQPKRRQSASSPMTMDPLWDTSAMGPHGKPFELDCEGTLAVCVQHEMDHLEGRVFVEYLSPLKQTRIRTRLRKRHARQA